jgi:2-phosphosulfolactate phosphatase
MRWICHPLFNRMQPGATAGGIAVVIDVLRASTTIATALAHGAARVRPTLEVVAARTLAAAPHAPAGLLLGGERGGLKIEGFDLGNSPLEYTAAHVAGRPIVITTTNGTAAIDACGAAREVLVGAVVNRSAVAARARQLAAHHAADVIHLVCAGTDGEVTDEDLLAAGAILDAAAWLPGGDDDVLDAAGRDALADFRKVVPRTGRAAADAATLAAAAHAIAAAFASSRGGRNLVALGMQADLVAAAAIDSLSVVPRLDRGTGWLVGETAGRT